ncbi:MAG: rod shape-determining protein RodA [Deltaproteobacteria bacterium]|nr:rod shape-determining protein RodA [Deltaproteobacteria bacterium]
MLTGPLALLRHPWTAAAMLAALALCAVAIENLAFTDALMGTTYHRAQAVWLVIGLCSAGVVAAVDPVYVRRLASVGYLALVVLLALVLVVGREINYSRRWIEIGPMNLQPSEFMKLSVILVLADLFDQRRATAPWRLRDLWRPAVVLAIPVVLINLEPDLGTSIVVAAIGGSILLYEGVRGRSLALLAVAAVVAVAVAWETGAIRSYQKGRAEAWYQAIVEEDDDPKPTARRTQAEQALWAVGSGQQTGRSDDQAKNSILRHLPFVHTDFALAPFAARFGLFGTLGLFAAYFVVAAWGLRLADRATDRFDALLAVGVSALIFWQFFINAGMVIGLLPVVGITLPLISYGGSSVLTVLVGLGFLVNIALRRRTRAG